MGTCVLVNISSVWKLLGKVLVFPVGASGKQPAC